MDATINGPGPGLLLADLLEQRPEPRCDRCRSTAVTHALPWFGNGRVGRFSGDNDRWGWLCRPCLAEATPGAKVAGVDRPEQTAEQLELT